jgi:hypothetical protein
MEVAMTVHRIVTLGVSLLLAVAPAGGVLVLSDDAVGAVEAAAEPAGESIFQQRRDVDEVSRPEPPSGPATPSPFCSPSAPICP